MDEIKKEKVTKTVKTGISFGSALAMVISYVNWHSIFWAIIHELLPEFSIEEVERIYMRIRREQIRDQANRHPR